MYLVSFYLLNTGSILLLAYFWILASKLGTQYSSFFSYVTISKLLDIKDCPRTNPLCSVWQGGREWRQIRYFNLTVNALLLNTPHSRVDKTVIYELILNT